jgi:hypothetical protein
MLSSNRGHHLALGGCLAFLLLAIPALGQEAVEPQDRPIQSQESGDSDQTESAQESAQDAPPAAAFPAAEQPSSPNTDDRQRAEEDQGSRYPAFRWDGLITSRDTLAQWAMAALGIAATMLSGIAVFLLKRTLDATRDAVDEANATTAEARKQTNLAFNTMVRLERPYLYVNVGAALRPAFNSPPSVRCSLTNHGKLPATITSINKWLAPDPDFPLRLPSAGKIEVYEVVEPGGESQVFRAYVEGSEEGEQWADDIERLILYIEVTYDGPSGDTFYCDTFCFRGDSRQREFILTGGEEYNQRGSIGPSTSMLSSGEIRHDSAS